MRTQYGFMACTQCGCEMISPQVLTAPARYRTVCADCWNHNASSVATDAREWQCQRCGGDSLWCACRAIYRDALNVTGPPDPPRARGIRLRDDES